MSGYDVEPEDMTRTVVLDEKLNALLAGQRPAAGDLLGYELSFMLEQVQEAFPPVVVPEQVEDVHFAQMMDAAAGLSADTTAPMAVTQASAVVAAPWAPVRTGLLGKIRAGLSRRVAAATLALTTAFGGAAYAGILPAPIQNAVANAAAVIGLQLPRPGDEASAVVDEDDGEVTDGRPDATGHVGIDVGDDERKGTAGSDGDEGRGEREGEREGDRDDDPDDDGDAGAEADDAADDHDGDAEDRSEISDDGEDANDSERDDAGGAENDDDSHERDEPDGSSDDEAPLEDLSESESEADELDD